MVEAELEARGKARQGGQSAYQPGWYFVTDDKGWRGETPRELSADDISQILAHGWKLEKAPPSGNIADPTSPSLASGPIDFKAIDFATAAGVVEGIRPTAQKVWNVDLRLAQTFTSLPQEVQDEISDDYGHNCASGDQQDIGLVDGFGGNGKESGVIHRYACPRNTTGKSASAFILLSNAEAA